MSVIGQIEDVPEASIPRRLHVIIRYSDTKRIISSVCIYILDCAKNNCSRRLVLKRRYTRVQSKAKTSDFLKLVLAVDGRMIINRRVNLKRLKLGNR